VFSGVPFSAVPSSRYKKRSSSSRYQNELLLKKNEWLLVLFSCAAVGNSLRNQFFSLRSQFIFLRSHFLTLTEPL